MTQLTAVEKAAGRLFRDEQRAALAASHQDSPPGVIPSLWAAHIRHNCASRGGLSTSFRMHEIYLISPAYYVWLGADGLDVSTESGTAAGMTRPNVPAGRFAFFYKAGQCPCGLTGRSRQGQFVITADRPPAGKS